MLMAVDADQFALKNDGTFVLQADGTFGLGPDCLGSCDDDDIAGSYAVAFNGGDFTYSDTGADPDTGQNCGAGGQFSIYPYGGAWAYTYVKQTGFSCTSSQYGYDPFTYQTESQSNGVFIVTQVNLPVNCIWEIPIQFGVCVSGVWQSIQVKYRKECGQTPAGTYTYYSTTASWAYDPTKLSKPSSITLS
jgi:hypothetical protein